jgi:hypothetical protein
MKNFQLMSRGMVVVPLLNAVMRQPHLWNENTLRTEHPGTPHTEVSDIWLRFNDLEQGIAAVADEHESVNYPALLALPQARPIIFGVMGLVEGERLGRVLITRLPSGGKIAPHEDGGAHAAYYDRFHVVLNSNPGCLFRCGDETVHMATGELWWFDNSKEHEVINNSSDDRIHMIIDVRTSR